jgi:hypothetical protein
MTNFRMTNDQGSSNDEISRATVRALEFGLHASSLIRHSSFVIGHSQ